MSEDELNGSKESKSAKALWTETKYTIIVSLVVFVTTIGLSIFESMSK